MYCEADGRLLPQYLKLVYEEFDKQIKTHWHIDDDIKIGNKNDDNSNSTIEQYH